MTLNGKEILALDVPDDAKNFEVIESHSYFHSPRVEHSIGGVDLPKGQWSILGRAGELTEEQARGLVSSKIIYEAVERGDGTYVNGEVEDVLYTDYMEGYFRFSTALESWQSYCKANGIKENQLIIVKL